MFEKNQDGLTYKDIGKCRLVCQDLNSLILQMIDEEFYRRDSSSRECSLTWGGKLGRPDYTDYYYTRRCLFDGWHVTKILEHFKETHPPGGPSSPFRSCRIRFPECFDRRMPIEDTWDLIDAAVVSPPTPLFSAYGSHFRQLDLEVGPFGGNCWNYRLLHSWLWKCPNLEVLRLQWLCTRCDDLDEMTNLEEVMREHPLPALEQLKYLEVGEFHHLPFNRILECSGGHIEKLKISCFTDRDKPHYWNYELSKLPLDKMRELDIQLESSEPLNDFEWLETVPPWKCLKKLTLTFVGAKSDLKWTSIFDFLARFHETLTHLKLVLPAFSSKLASSFHDLSATRSARLELPNVVEMELEFPQRSLIFSLDFLLHMKNLRVLSLRSSFFLVHQDRKSSPLKKLLRMVFQKKAIRVKFQERHIDKMEESNIWKALPKLYILILCLRHRQMEPEMWRKVGGANKNGVSFFWSKPVYYP